MFGQAASPELITILLLLILDQISEPLSVFLRMSKRSSGFPASPLCFSAQKTNQTCMVPIWLNHFLSAVTWFLPYSEVASCYPQQQQHCDNTLHHLCVWLSKWPQPGLSLMLQSIGPGCYGNSQYLVSSGNIWEQCIGEIGGFVPEISDRMNLLFLLLLLLSSFRRSEAVMDGQQ